MGCRVSHDRCVYRLHHRRIHHRSNFVSSRVILKTILEEDEESVQESRQIRPHALGRNRIDSNLMNDYTITISILIIKDI